jgi:TRAP-type C4-dicarboxylate transport system permease large subunit
MKITAFFLTVSSDKYVILLMINIMLLVLGAHRHGAVDPDHQPILLPVVMKFGVDGSFRHIMLLNPGWPCHRRSARPSSSACRRPVRMEGVMREIWPFYGVMFLVLMLVTYIPAISLWLPRLLSL